MASDDLILINRHLRELRQEIAELRGSLEQVAALEREASLQEVVEVLMPVLDRLVGFRAGDARYSAEEVTEELERALPALGLTPRFKTGEVVELWPEEIAERFIVDSSVPSGAAMARVEVVANGWNRGRMVVARTWGQVLEIINGERDV